MALVSLRLLLDYQQSALNRCVNGKDSLRNDADILIIIIISIRYSKVLWVLVWQEILVQHDELCYLHYLT